MAKVIKPRLAKGTRDFSPTEMALRRHIFGVIEKYFKRFGFDQIETPAVENLETLTGKYGEEGDRLIFKILNSGDYLDGVDSTLLQNRESNALIPQLCEKALRYDLTVPFARYVVQHRNDISFPFRRYQIQPVWRADRPQKGRYREFYQCDADVIGSNSLLLEAEFIQLITLVFRELNINYTIKLNSRKILFGFCEALGIESKFTAFTTILDKLDKKPWQALKTEFLEAGFSDDQTKAFESINDLNGLELSKTGFENLKAAIKLSNIGQQGLAELQEIMSYLSSQTLSNVRLDLTLARGLNYYTGAIIEVSAKDVDIGSICGGGRYDDLTGIFGLEEMSGIGISFGIDRIFDILSASPSADHGNKSTSVVFINFGNKELDYSLKALDKLRSAGIRAEIYPDPDKLKKQFKYADNKGASHVVTAGELEITKSMYTLKDLKTGEQEHLNMEGLINTLGADADL
ncbi:MAG: histidine--tRNA ligase [Vicingaceae bacterium]